MEKVSVVNCLSYKSKEVRDALESSLKNIGFSFKKGMKILIKPNLLLPVKPERGITTHPFAVLELCKILKKKGAKIYIGESSSYNTNEALEVCGMNKLSSYASIINFESCDKKFFDFGSEIGKIPFPKIIFDVDLIINFAKMKTHGFTKVSLCAKNLYGCIPGKLKGELHKKVISQKSFSKFLFEIEKIVKPGLNIIDGIGGLEGEGPGASGNPIKSEVIIAGRNAFAVDIIATEFMGLKHEEVYTNLFSGIRLEDIEVSGNGKGRRADFKKAVAAEFPIFILFTKLMPKEKISFDYNKCKKCGICGSKCPVNAINFKPEPECNHKKCIKCLCCIEVCPEGAISLKKHFLIAKLKSVYGKLVSQ